MSKLPVNCAAACFQARAADLTAWRSVPGAGAGGEGVEVSPRGKIRREVTVREDGSEDRNEIELKLGQEIYPSYCIT